MGAPEPRWARSMDKGSRRKRIREFGEGSDRRTGHTEPTRAAFEGLFTIFKDPIYRILTQIKDKPYIKWPLKMVSNPRRRNPNLWCSHHQENGYLIEKWIMFQT